MSRPGYCPIGNEPCQSLCETPCSTRKPLTDEQINAHCPKDFNCLRRKAFHDGVRLAEARHGIAVVGGVTGDIDGEWYCEVHPEHLMGHNGCTGAGIIESARIFMLVTHLQAARQEAREAKWLRDDVVAQIRRSKKEDAP